MSAIFLVALLFTTAPACGVRASDARAVEAGSAVENPFHALLNASDVMIASPVVATGRTATVREGSSAQGQVVRLDAERTHRGGRDGRPIVLDLSRLALRLAAGTAVVAGVRYDAAEPRARWTLVAGRDGLLIEKDDRFERIRPDGALEAVGGRGVRCSLGDLPCYAQALASRGIVTAAQRASLDRSRRLDPELALLYLIALRSNRVRSFPVERCAELRWTCASSDAYRRLLHYGYVL